MKLICWLSFEKFKTDASCFQIKALFSISFVLIYLVFTLPGLKSPFKNVNNYPCERNNTTIVVVRLLGESPWPVPEILWIPVVWSQAPQKTKTLPQCMLSHHSGNLSVISFPTCMTLLLSPVISASFCSVWASGLLSCANWVCITCEKRRSTGKTVPRPMYVRGRADCTCSCSAVNDVRALLAGFGWQSWSEGRAPSRVNPVPFKIDTWWQEFTLVPSYEYKMTSVETVSL